MKCKKNNNESYSYTEPQILSSCVIWCTLQSKHRPINIQRLQNLFYLFFFKKIFFLIICVSLMNQKVKKVVSTIIFVLIMTKKQQSIRTCLIPLLRKCDHWLSHTYRKKQYYLPFRDSNLHRKHLPKSIKTFSSFTVQIECHNN